jgi:hypothetical protein
MGIKIKILKEQADLFRNTGNLCNSSNGGIYMNIPYWLKETDEEYVYEYLTTEQLPDDIRNGLDFNKYSDSDMTNYALYILHNDVITPKEWFKQFKNK